MTILTNLRLTLAALCVALPLSAAAQPVKDEAVFDLVMKGLTAGSLRFSATQDGAAYSAAGRLETGGLVALLRKVKYDASVSGSVNGGTYTPSSYSENADTGKRQSESVMAYRAGVPQVKTYNPPRKPKDFDIDPASQGGTVDPLTALYATLRDVAPGQECKVNVKMFDGRRASQLSLGEPKARDGTVKCSGEYRRVAGFSAEDMKEKTRFPFTLTYAPTADGRMRVVEVAMDTLYGKARLTRR
ncbi:MAG: DUF3108 domain-containing protein [Pseudomonadota bacterium]